MFQSSYKAILGILASILIAATGLWGLFTYWPDRLSFVPSDRAGGADSWGTLLILAIGLAIGGVTKRCLLRGQELPGGIWTMLVAGVLGAWLGGTLLGKWGWVWGGVNLIGSLITALALAWGGGQILACLGGKGRS